MVVVREAEGEAGCNRNRSPPRLSPRHLCRLAQCPGLMRTSHHLSKSVVIAIPIHSAINANIDNAPVLLAIHTLLASALHHPQPSGASRPSHSAFRAVGARSSQGWVLAARSCASAWAAAFVSFAQTCDNGSLTAPAAATMTARSAASISKRRYRTDRPARMNGGFSRTMKSLPSELSWPDGMKRPRRMRRG
jgi:hypothetical protein